MSHVSELPYDQRPSNRDLSHMHGDYGWPFVGKTWDIFRDPHTLFDDHYEKYGPISRISLTGSKCVPAELRQGAVALAKAEHALGEPYKSIATALGVKAVTTSTS
jgi:hypothetical protein